MGEMPEDLDAAMAWMEALAARQGADEASLQITAPEDRSTETPEWIKSQGVEEPIVAAEAEIETPDWMKLDASEEAQVESVAEELVETTEEAVAEAADVPDWLKEMAPTEAEPLVEAASEASKSPLLKPPMCLIGYRKFNQWPKRQ